MHVVQHPDFDFFVGERDDPSCGWAHVFEALYQFVAASGLVETCAEETKTLVLGVVFLRHWSTPLTFAPSFRFAVWHKCSDIHGRVVAARVHDESLASF